MKKLLSVLILLFTMSAFCFTPNEVEKEKLEVENVIVLNSLEFTSVLNFDTIKKLIPNSDSFLLGYHTTTSFHFNDRFINKKNSDKPIFNIDNLPLFKNHFLKNTKPFYKLKTDATNSIKINRASIHYKTSTKIGIQFIPDLQKSKYFISDLCNSIFHKNLDKSFSRHQFTELYSLQNDFLSFKLKV
jgi:hypothetical protein